MSKEFSELNGYGVKDAVAREEIEQLKENGVGKLYYHDIVIKFHFDMQESYQNEYSKFNFTVPSTDATPCTVEKTRITSTADLKTFLDTYIPKGLYSGTQTTTITNELYRYGSGIINRFSTSGIEFVGIDKDGVGYTEKLVDYINKYTYCYITIKDTAIEQLGGVK